MQAIKKPHDEEAMTKKPSRPASRLWVALLVSVLVAAAMDRARASWLSSSVATGDAEWIWCPDCPGGEPRAFWAVRDFYLDRALEAARISIQVDSEYQLYLDRRWIGANQYRLGAEVDSYLLERVLPGAHRILIEARATTGGGGILFSLEDVSGQLVLSDDSWTIFRQAAPGVLAGTSGLETGESPAVLGRPPLGRWRRPKLAAAKPPMEVVGEHWSQAIATFPVALVNEPEARVGTRIDFGAPVSGVLELWFSPPADATWQLRTADANEQLAGQPPTEAIRVPGRSRWRDSRARTLRYAWIEGAAPVAARVIEVEGLRAKDIEGPGRGPFGLEPPDPAALSRLGDR